MIPNQGYNIQNNQMIYNNMMNQNKNMTNYMNINQGYNMNSAMIQNPTASPNFNNMQMMNNMNNNMTAIPNYNNMINNMNKNNMNAYMLNSMGKINNTIMNQNMLINNNNLMNNNNVINNKAMNNINAMNNNSMNNNNIINKNMMNNNNMMMNNNNVMNNKMMNNNNNLMNNNNVMNNNMNNMNNMNMNNMNMNNGMNKNIVNNNMNNNNMNNNYMNNNMNNNIMNNNNMSNNMGNNLNRNIMNNNIMNYNNMNNNIMNNNIMNNNIMNNNIMNNNNMNNNQQNQQNNMGINNSFKINYDFMNNNNEDLDNEMKLISEKVSQVFTDGKISQLNSEKDILKFFAEKEKECLDFVDKSFGGYETLRHYMLKEIEKVFKTNPNIKSKTEVVYSKLEQIHIEQFSSEKEYEKKLKSIFGKENIPEFLIEEDLKNLRSIIFYQNRKNETTTIINNLKARNSNEDNGKLIDYYEKMRKKEIYGLNDINHKLELLYLFLTVNYKVFRKPYCNGTFFSFLETNMALINQYFQINTTYNQIYANFINMNEQEANNKQENLILIINSEINNSDKILKILAFFYCILFYEFKDLKNYNEISNIGNVYVNLLLKNFAIYLDQKFRALLKSNKNLFELLQELYIVDIDYLKGLRFYSSLNKEFSFQNIDSLLMSDPTVSQNYSYLKENFSKNQNNDDGFFTLIKKNLENIMGKVRELTVYEKNIKLVPVDDTVFSNTITILIDGFTTEDKNQLDQWKDLIHSFKKETMFYFYKWPSDSKDNILSQGILKAIKNSPKYFKAATSRAKICGKMLAYILLSSHFFKNFQINLIGFSLGNHVIKHCIKEIKKINTPNNSVKLKNVILIAAATHIRNKQIWKQCKEEFIIDRFINCFSKKDKILKMAYSSCMMKDAVGNDSLIINDDNGNNLVQNYDFTENKFGHLSYKYNVVVEKAFPFYKAI